MDDGQYSVKAWLVARGFEENLNETDVRVDSTTAGKVVLKNFLSILANDSWNCQRTDSKAAFLQGDNFHREVLYILSPQGS